MLKKKGRRILKMKKLSKKQKLVGFIAILIVAVIIAIVITTSVIK